MTTPTVTASPREGTFDVFGKKTSELQEDIVVTGNKITGTLHYVKDYTGFSGLPEEQKGHFLVMHYVPDPYEADVHVLKTSGTVGDKILSKPDLTMVSRITDKEHQKLEVYSELSGVKGEKTIYDISGLTLEPDNSET